MLGLSSPPRLSAETSGSHGVQLMSDQHHPKKIEPDVFVVPKITA